MSEKRLSAREITSLAAKYAETQPTVEVCHLEHGDMFMWDTGAAQGYVYMFDKNTYREDGTIEYSWAWCVAGTASGRIVPKRNRDCSENWNHCAQVRRVQLVAFPV